LSQIPTLIRRVSLQQLSNKSTNLSTNSLFSRNSFSQYHYLEIMPFNSILSHIKPVKVVTHTVRLLSFMTDIIKCIHVKEMTLLLLSFRQRSLLTVHTYLHGDTASGCPCRSRPLQWCLMYLSLLSGCPKSSQRGTPSSGISLLRTKSNQQMLNLANTERVYPFTKTHL